MVYLSLMWTTIFCAAFGIWIWYGQILAIHMLILGIAVTGMTFEMRIGHVSSRSFFDGLLRAPFDGLVCAADDQFVGRVAIFSAVWVCGK